MPRRKNPSLPTHSMFPDLHGSIIASLQSSNPGLSFTFHCADTYDDSTQDYDTNIMGSFICNNRNCKSSGWSSKKIAISIREYSGERYNARVYHQRCKQCDWVSQPQLDEESYVDRITYRLKKWSGVTLPRPSFTGGESKGPHDRKRCEGCKAGHCNESSYEFKGWVEQLDEF